MFCSKCGRELIDGEVCTCDNNAEQQTNQAYYEPTPQPEQAYYQPPEVNNNPEPLYYAPIAQQVRTDYPEGYTIRKKYVALILAVTLGMFGAHHFYLGDQTKGIIQILLSTIGAIVFGLGPVASLIWVIVETVFILTDKTKADSNGFKLQTFAEELAEKINK